MAFESAFVRGERDRQRAAIKRDGQSDFRSDTEETRLSSRPEALSRLVRPFGFISAFRRRRIRLFVSRNRFDESKIHPSLGTTSGASELISRTGELSPSQEERNAEFQITF